MSTAYRVPVMEKFSWQDPVTSILSTPPATPVKGDRYIVGASATDEWAGKEKNIAWYNGVEWKFDNPVTGWRIFNKADSNFYTYVSNAWSNATTVGNLTINGNTIDSTVSDVDWNLKDNTVDALEFVTASNVSMLKFNTTDDAEQLIAGVVLKALSDVDLSNASKTIKLATNTASALKFDSTSTILSIDSTEGAEKIVANSNVVVNGNLTVQGTTTTVNTEELLVHDKLITLNDGGTDATALGAGIEVEGDSDTIKAYFKLDNTSGTSWKLSNFAGKILTIIPTNDATLDLSGNLTVESASVLNQDLTTDATPTFFNLNLSNGKITVTPNVSGAFKVSDGTNDFVQIDTTTGSQVVKILTALNLSGNVTLSSGGTIVDSASALTLTDHNSVSVTVAQAYKAYDNRAQYDDSLGCIVFPDTLDHIA